MINLLDPWTADAFDYDKIVKKFGIKNFQEELVKIKNPNRLMRRGVILGHRDFNKITNLINKNEPFAVVTGMMPSGQMHIGHKMVVDQLIWYQENGGRLSLPIADLEAYAARGISFEKGKELAINEYLTNYIALGLNIDHDVNIYLQSQNQILQDLSFRASMKTNFSEMKAIYGFTPSTNLAHLTAPISQVADILIPQVEEYVVPEEAYSKKDAEPELMVEEVVAEPVVTPRKSHRWTFKEEKDLVGYYQAGMTIDQLAKLFGKDEDAVREKLAQKGIAV